MNILIVSATNTELYPFAKVNFSAFQPNFWKKIGDANISILITGIGAVPTSFYLAKYVLNYDLIINLGIAGAFNKNLNIGDIVFVKQDVFGDYGIDNNGKFIPLYKSKIVPESTGLLANGFMVNPWHQLNQLPCNWQEVNGITLGTVSGSTKAIESIKQYWDADIETMESASVFYSCLSLNVPFICIRSISNFVEPRNKLKWEINIAIENLAKFLNNFLPTISKLEPK